MSDPRDRDFRSPGLERPSDGVNAGVNAAWGWIAGAVFVVIVLVLVFGYGMNTNTASNPAMPSATTTGSGTTSPQAVPPPAATPTPSDLGSPSNPNTAPAR